LKLLEYDKHIALKILLPGALDYFSQPFDRENTPGGCTGFHSPACFGFVKITVALFEMKEEDAQATDFHSNIVVTWAAKGRHEGGDEDIVKYECKNIRPIPSISLVLTSRTGK